MNNERKLALQKKSTLLFIQENPNDPQSKDNDKTNLADKKSNLIKKRTMIDQIKSGSFEGN